MKYYNRSNYILTGAQPKILPHTVSRDYSEKELAENPYIVSRIDRGVLIPYTGEQSVNTPAQHQDPRYEVEQTFHDKKITKVANGKPVTYVVASTEGADAVHMMDEGMVTSMGKEVNKSPDFIETGVDASKFRNGADAMEAELNTEFQESTFDDEDSLAENESERDTALDVDHAIDMDNNTFVKKDGKMGGSVTTAKDQIQAEVTKGLNTVAQEVSKSLEDGEQVATGNNKVVEFLRQPLNAKKYMISKENDKQLLTDIQATTHSEVVKKLVTQRISELR